MADIHAKFHGMTPFDPTERIGVLEDIRPANATKPVGVERGNAVEVQFSHTIEVEIIAPDSIDSQGLREGLAVERISVSIVVAGEAKPELVDQVRSEIVGGRSNQHAILVHEITGREQQFRWVCHADILPTKASENLPLLADVLIPADVELVRAVTVIDVLDVIGAAVKTARDRYRRAGSIGERIQRKQFLRDGAYAGQ